MGKKKIIANRNNGSERGRIIRRPRSRIYEMTPIQLKTYLKEFLETEKNLNRYVIGHSERIFDIALQYSGDMELAVFALCHHSDYETIHKKLEPMIGLFNPNDFKNYNDLRRADMMGITPESLAIYSRMLVRASHLVFLRGLELSDLAHSDKKEREKIYRNIEQEVPVRIGLEKIESAIASIYFHTTVKMGSWGIVRNLEDVQTSVRYPELFGKCRDYLDDKHDDLTSVKELIMNEVLPHSGGEIGRVRARIKRPASLANKLIEKAEEKGQPTGENEILKNMKKLIDTVTDCVAFEVNLESMGMMKWFADQIKDKLEKGKKFDEIKVECRSKTKGDQKQEITFITGRCKKTKCRFEIQVQTEETQRIRGGEIFHHAIYKGWPEELGVKDGLRNMRALLATIQRRSLEPPETTISRNLVDIIEIEPFEDMSELSSEELNRRKYMISIPRTARLVDVLARTTGVDNFLRVRTYMDSVLIHQLGEYSSPYLLTQSIQTDDLIFVITKGGVKYNGQLIKKLRKRFDRAPEPVTLEGETQLNIVLGKYGTCT